MFAEFSGPRTRPPEKLPFVEIFAVISVRTPTQQTTKHRERSKRKAPPKGSQPPLPESLCKHHMKETEAQWTENGSAEPNKKIGLERSYLVSPSLHECFTSRLGFNWFRLKGETQRALWVIKVMFAISMFGLNGFDCFRPNLARKQCMSGEQRGKPRHFQGFRHLRGEETQRQTHRENPF